jgi:putative methyltransferase (TIGR04325 family)
MVNGILFGCLCTLRAGMLSTIRLLRVKQIRFTARLLRAVEALPGGNHLMRRVATWPITAPILNAMLGYLRVFDSLPEAVAAARPYAEGGHEDPEHPKHHMSLAEVPRPSDYAALFHMRGLVYDRAKIFDLGGSIGNLFYLYDRYLNLPSDCIWLVFELPAWVELGRNVATNRGENRLQFTRKWQDATGAELLIASGSLHYFDPPLSQMVSELLEKPTHILINRTPLIEGPTKATVQDGGTHRVGCVLHNRAEFVTAFEAIGYNVVDSWKASELSLNLVGKSESSALPYSGFFFRLKEQVPKRGGHDTTTGANTPDGSPVSPDPPPLDRGAKAMSIAAHQATARARSKTFQAISVIATDSALATDASYAALASATDSS